MKVLFTLFLLFVPLFAHAQPGYLVIGKDQQWQGEMRLTQPVLVAAGVTLVLAPGTKVQAMTTEAQIRIEGAIEARGTAQEPINFLGPAGWNALELVQSADVSRLVYSRFASAGTAISSTQANFTADHVLFSGCDTAIKLHRQSNPRIENSEFVDNRIALDVEMRSHIELRNNQFTGNQTALLASHNSSGEVVGNRFEKNELAVRIQHEFPGRIAENLFADNQQALVCDQTMSSPLVSGNRFQGNRQGLISLLASKPQVVNNRFSGNREALVNNQLGSPVVERNLFNENEVAIKSERRSAPQIQRNEFTGNRLALLCDYLSYPLVKQNNFSANQLAVRLGEHQSSDREQRAGGQLEFEKFISQSGRQGKMAVFPPTEDMVDVRQNWWGITGNDDELAQLFYDRQDERWIVDEAGTEQYLRDRVEFSPWLSQPVADAGLQ